MSVHSSPSPNLDERDVAIAPRSSTSSLSRPVREALGANLSRRPDLTETPQLSRWRSSPLIAHIPVLDLLPGPGRPPQEGQAGLDGRIKLEAANRDTVPHLLPAVFLHQVSDNLFQLHAVEGIIGMGLVRHIGQPHKSTLAHWQRQAARHQEQLRGITRVPTAASRHPTRAGSPRRSRHPSR